METYKVVESIPNAEARDLVNVKDDNDRIMAHPDHFQKIGEVVTDNQFRLKQCNYVDEQGSGTTNFAFRK